MLLVVRLAQVLHLLRLADGVVLTGHVVGNKVDNYLQASLMGALHQLFKLFHTLFHVHRQVGVNVIIVRNGVRRSSLTLHDSRMLTRNTIGAIVGLCGVTDDARIPYMTDAHLLNVLQYLRGKVGHLTTTIFGNRAVLFARQVAIAEKTGKYLIDNNLIVHFFRFTLQQLSRGRLPHG